MNELLKVFNTLVLYDYNIRILHWKVVGLDFGTKHQLMDDYHSQLNTMIDEVAECILMLHGDVPSFIDITHNTGNDQDVSYTLLSGSATYSVEKLLETTRSMFTQLISFYDEIWKTDIPEDIKSKLQDHQYWLRLETRYKLDSTLTK